MASVVLATTLEPRRLSPQDILQGDAARGKAFFQVNCGVCHSQELGYYGWPWYYIGNNEDPRHAGERPDLAGKAIVPDVLEQSHSASLQMTFYTATSGWQHSRRTIAGTPL